MNDITLVTQVVVFGNKRAFDALLRKYQSQVRRFLLGLTVGDSQLADDLAQETFIKAYMNIGKFRGLSSFSTWIMRIAYNTHYDYRRTHHQTEDADTPAVAARSGGTTADCALGMDILKALATLKPEEHNAAAHRGAADRQDSKHNGNDKRHGEITPTPRKGETDNLSKEQRI